MWYGFVLLAVSLNLNLKRLPLSVDHYLDVDNVLDSYGEIFWVKIWFQNPRRHTYPFVNNHRAKEYLADSLLRTLRTTIVRIS